MTEETCLQCKFARPGLCLASIGGTRSNDHRCHWFELRVKGRRPYSLPSIRRSQGTP